MIEIILLHLVIFLDQQISICIQEKQITTVQTVFSKQFQSSFRYKSKFFKHKRRIIEYIEKKSMGIRESVLNISYPYGT